MISFIDKRLDNSIIRLDYTKSIKDIYVILKKVKCIILKWCIIKNFTIKESKWIRNINYVDHHEIIDDNFIKKYKRDSKINIFS